MTTKQDFIHAAKVISVISDIADRSTVCNSFIKFFSEQNPRFDAKKFSVACGVVLNN